MTVPYHALGVNTPLAQSFHHRIDDFPVSAFQFSLPPPMAFFVFLWRIEGERRPLDNMGYDQLVAGSRRPIPCVIQCPIAAFAAVNTYQQDFAHSTSTSEDSWILNGSYRNGQLDTIPQPVNCPAAAT
jgi:hypothetical protein